MFFFQNTPYIAIIGDIVDSRKAENRNEVQTTLRNTLRTINDEYSGDIASKFMVTLGDEFQGLLQAGGHIVKILEKIAFAMHPVKIRFGIGVGAITTDINPDMPLGSDGPAYYHAREMINELRSLESRKMEAVSDILIKIEGHTELSALINTIFTLSAVIKSGWTQRQREIIQAYTKRHATQTEVANMLGIRQSNVNKALSASRYYAYHKAMSTVSNILSNINGGTHA